ncbi:MAG: PfkB family carbohydrate kinase, partial [Treponema sp.]|nr:PfkB family carbohydrate kinase [Treponema sp.]
NWQTHVYHKIYTGREELPRYDMGNRNCPGSEQVDRILEILEARLDAYDCVIINEQVPAGLHSPYFQERLAALIGANRDRVIWFADCRKLNDRYNHTIRKLNNLEAAEILIAAGQSREKAGDPRYAASWLYRRWGLPVVLTLGGQGALVQDGSGCRELESLHFAKEIDIVGAGDAFLAGLVTSLGAGLSLYDAALIGTFSAGVSLGKLFETGHPTVEEVLALADEGDFNYHVRQASDESSACYAEGTDIEIVGSGPEKRRGFPEAAIFDHDGTVSVLRQGWEEVMFKVMVDAIAGQGPRKDLAEIKAAVSLLIEKTTGIQTLAQMYRLRELVVSFGHVKKEDVLSPEAYKAVYNKALLGAMEKRVRGVEEGRLLTEDVTIKGAVAFLKKLSAAGTKLYLASGTDQDDVIREARLLGYAGLFTGGIRGSVGDIKNDPKKLVIRNIISGIKAAGGDRAGVVVFGDGPVEMREARKEGILAVGVLSDERRRYGLNLNKRERLILGGADILIPDFSWSNELARILGWE